MPSEGTARAIYKTRFFDRWARKQDLSTSALCSAVREMQQGLVDADLGGGLFKKRVARPEQGKSGGFRTLVATNRSSRWFFVFGFSKNERGNIDSEEEQALKRLAAHLLSSTSRMLDLAEEAGELIKVDCDAQNEVGDS